MGAMDVQAAERLLLGRILQPGEQLYHFAFGGAYVAPVSELPRLALEAARQLGPAVLGAVALSSLPGSSLLAGASEMLAGDSGVRGALDNTILALTSARLLLVEARWVKLAGRPWEPASGTVRGWTAEQLRASSLSMTHEKRLLGSAWYLRTGEPERPGEYQYSWYPHAPRNRDEARAIAGRIALARG